MKKSKIFVIILLSLVSFMGLKIHIDTISRVKVPGSSIIYIPSGKYLKYATFGFPELAADLVYLWAIQYYSDYSIPDRFEYMDHIFSIIAELDPKYVDPYHVGSLIAVMEAHDLNLALKILERGFEKNPDQWLFPFLAGHYAQMYGNDFQVARAYYKQAMEIEGAPVFTERLYANAAFKSNDYQTAWEDWLNIYENAPDEETKKIASNHLYNIKATIDKIELEKAITKYKEKFGHFPEDLSRLVQAGYIKNVPKDLDNNDYVYDPETGEVTTEVIPWKR